MAVWIPTNLIYLVNFDLKTSLIANIQLASFVSSLSATAGPPLETVWDLKLAQKAITDIYANFQYLYFTVISVSSHPDE